MPSPQPLEEQYARAICAASQDAHRRPNQPEGWVPPVDLLWPEYMPEARAAIALTRVVLSAGASVVDFDQAFERAHG